MKKQLILLVGIIFLSFFFVNPSFSNQVGAPFDSNIEKIPQNFKGNNIVALYKKLSIAPQGEFESRDQYMERVKSVTGETYAFVIENADIKYNPNRQVFEISIPSNLDKSYTFSSPGIRFAVYPESSRKFIKSYDGVNNFGVRATIREYVEHKYGIILFEKTRFINMSLPMDIEIAKERSKNLKVILVANTHFNSIPEPIHIPSNAIISKAKGKPTHLEYKTPTTSSPTEVTTFYYSIRANVNGFWVYDSKSGEILGKFSESGKKLN